MKAKLDSEEAKELIEGLANEYPQNEKEVVEILLEYCYNYVNTSRVMEDELLERVNLTRTEHEEGYEQELIVGESDSFYQRKP